MMVKLSSGACIFVCHHFIMLHELMLKKREVGQASILPLFLNFVTWLILFSLFLFLSLTLPWTRTLLLKVLNLLVDLCFLISIYLCDLLYPQGAFQLVCLISYIYMPDFSQVELSRSVVKKTCLWVLQNLVFPFLHFFFYVAYGSYEACSSSVSDRVMPTVDLVCKSSFSVVEFALCVQLSLFHLPVASGSSLYCLYISD